MKCPNCGGTGEMQICEMGFIGKDECDKCHGKGYLNNDEWRKTCSAEEFAEELAKVVLDLVLWNNDPKPSEVRNILKAWLKQPHRHREE